MKRLLYVFLQPRQKLSLIIINLLPQSLQVIIVMKSLSSLWVSQASQKSVWNPKPKADGFCHKSLAVNILTASCRHVFLINSVFYLKKMWEQHSYFRLWFIFCKKRGLVLKNILFPAFHVKIPEPTNPIQLGQVVSPSNSIAGTTWKKNSSGQKNFTLNYLQEWIWVVPERQNMTKYYAAHTAHSHDMSGSGLLPQRHGLSK